MSHDMSRTGDMLDLFPETIYPAVPGARREETSRQAADVIAPKVNALRKRVVDCLKAQGAMTPDEAAAALSLDILTVRPRFSELARMGMIVKTGERRRARGGQSRCMANVWRAT